MADIVSASSGPPRGRSSRRRERVVLALAAAALAVALIPLGGLPIGYAIPIAGLLLAAGTPPDTGPAARSIRPGARNVIIGIAVLAAVAVVAFQPQLLVPLVTVFGVQQYTLVVTLCAVAALALPLALAESTGAIDTLPPGRAVLTRRSLVLALTPVVTVAFWYGSIGQSFLALAAVVLVLPVLLAVARVRHAVRGRVEPVFRHGPGRSARLLQLLNYTVLSGLLAAAMLPGTFDALRLDFTPAGYHAFLVAYCTGLVVLVVLALVPLRRVRPAGNVAVLAGSVFLVVQLVTVYRPPADPVTIAFPLAEPGYVIQGGQAELTNYHVVISTQRDAADIVQVVGDRTYAGDSAALSDYHIFGDPVLAPADGVVTEVVNDLPDQRIGTVDNRHQAGNHLVIDIGAGRSLALCHLQHGSVRVAVGDRLRAGQQLALVGNSGNTDQPHLHIQAQNRATLDDAAGNPVALLRSLHTYPILFRDVLLTRGGESSTPATAGMRRGDVLGPL
ncbi:hypothetical protein GCM10010168_31440 [Actinoplanes ianthinogenes]|uniref:M23ase beta-sheet core domain-containing protein n=1 Tax=Actinoplanes ianthinogenes TaxID=122358 RepID=A0ABM7LM13_9ACTN|nr:M23 family metallopeptidase [Actinoplanes ianthinogenes]BCJ40285.1 hypothetical protein Aiant_09420 [Actinoplanes ianthinogenes]GGR11361.1 hypothetical protein GCM10010168_31440 [Actinoplanes ianthinogenes]